MTMRARPNRVRLLFLLLLAVAVAALSSATDGDEAVGVVGTATKLRTKSTPADQDAGDLEIMKEMLASVLGKLEHLESRFRSLEEENERRTERRSPQDPSDPERRTSQGAPRTVPLTQFNDFKRSVAAQLTTLDQSLSSTRSLLEAVQKSVNDKAGGIKAEIQKVWDSLLFLANKTEAVEQKATELEARVEDLETNQANLSEDITGLSGEVAAGSVALAGAVAQLKALSDKAEDAELKAAELETRVNDLETSQASLTEDIGGLSGKVSAGSAELAEAVALLETTSQGLSSLTARLACVDAASDGDELVFSGCNINIRNGDGQTDSTNGRGNLIVGYNENGVGRGFANRTGSHMVVVGPRHGWQGFGGIVSGDAHRQESGYASIIGGT